MKAIREEFMTIHARELSGAVSLCNAGKHWQQNQKERLTQTTEDRRVCSALLAAWTSCGEKKQPAEQLGCD